MKVGCFGKLPISPEFIKVNASGEALKAFDQWLQEGIQYARTKQRDWSKDFLKMDTWNFVFVMPETQELLIGVLSPSQDRAGRTFPFLLFICADKSELSQPLHFVPMMYRDFLLQARETAEIGWKNIDAQTFRMKIQNTAPLELKDQQDAYETYLRDHDVRQLFNGACEPQNSMTRGNVRETMLQYLVSLQGNHAQSFDSSIRIPFQSRETLSACDVVFWMEIVSKLWCEIDACSMFCWVEKPKDDAPYFFATSGPATPKMFLSLLQASRHGQERGSHGDSGVESHFVQGDREERSVANEPIEVAIEDTTCSGITLNEIRSALGIEMNA